MWRAAVPASYTILSVRSMPVAFCFRETRLRANLIPSFPSQVFSIQMIMIIHTTDGFTSRWPCLDCQIVPVFFKKNYDDVEWQEIMSRQLYGTYISISSIETIRKSRQKQRGANSFPVRVASQSIDAWKQTSLWNEKYWKQQNMAVRDKQRCSESCVIAKKDEIVQKRKTNHLTEWNYGLWRVYPFRYDSAQVHFQADPFILAKERTQCITNLFGLLPLKCPSCMRPAPITTSFPPWIRDFQLVSGHF